MNTADQWRKRQQAYATANEKIDASEADEWTLAMQVELEEARGKIDRLRAERDALIREFGEFKNEQREARALWYMERDYLRQAHDLSELSNELLDGELVTYHTGVPD